jgi:hypothetical protein
MRASPPRAAGIIFLAMPLSIVGSTFEQVWDERQVFQMQRRLRQLLAESGVEPGDAVTAFRQMDAGGDGAISRTEFDSFLATHNFALGVGERRAVWAALDTDRSGTLSLAEFIERAFPEADAAALEGLDASDSQSAAGGSFRRPASQGGMAAHAGVVKLLEAQAVRTERLEARLESIEASLSQLLALQRADAPHAGGQSTSLHHSRNGRSGSKSRPPKQPTLRGALRAVHGAGILPSRSSTPQHDGQHPREQRPQGGSHSRGHRASRESTEPHPQSHAQAKRNGHTPKLSA